MKQPDGQAIVRDKIADRVLLTCYLCGEINGQPGVFESESLYHMLVECTVPKHGLLSGTLEARCFCVVEVR